MVDNEKWYIKKGSIKIAYFQMYGYIIIDANDKVKLDINTYPQNPQTMESYDFIRFIKIIDTLHEIIDEMKERYNDYIENISQCKDENK